MNEPVYVYHGILKGGDFYNIQSNMDYMDKDDLPPAIRMKFDLLTAAIDPASTEHHVDIEASVTTGVIEGIGKIARIVRTVDMQDGVPRVVTNLFLHTQRTGKKR